MIPESHKLGVLNREHHSSFLTEAQAEEHCPDAKVVDLVLKPGQVGTTLVLP